MTQAHVPASSVENQSFVDMEEYFRLFQGPAFKDRYLLEWQIMWTNRDRESYTLPGVCRCCKKGADFHVDREFGARLVNNVWEPNWRERQVCPECLLNSRQRAAYSFVESAVQDIASPTMYLMEQTTPFFKRCSQDFVNADVIGSEYLGPEFTSGAVHEGLRHEDAMNLSLEDESVDVVVSMDVLEHVPNPEQAFREAYRILKANSAMFLSVPFESSSLHNTTRADIVDGELVHHLPAVYHGNPLNLGDSGEDAGSLVFTDFGWQILEQLRGAGFREAVLEILWSYEYGHLGIASGGAEFFRVLK